MNAIHGFALLLLFTGNPAGDDRPLGKWERKINKNRIVLHLEANRLHVHFDGERTGTIHADYRITRDHVLYGVVTSVQGDDDDEELERDLIDQPFSCKIRVDEGVLSIRDLKLGTLDRQETNWSGRFRQLRVTAE